MCVGAGALNAFAYLRIAEADNDYTYSGDGASGLTLFQAQIVEKPSAFPPMPTEGSIYVSSGKGMFYDNRTFIVYPQNVSTTLWGDEYGANVITNGDFSTWIADDPVGWTVTGELGSDPMIREDANGDVNIYSSGAVVQMQQNILVSGQHYKVGINVSGVTSGSFDILLGTNTIADITTTGEKWFYGTANTSTLFLKRYTTPCDISFSAVTVYQVTSAWDSGPSSSAGLGPNHGFLMQFWRSGSDWDAGVGSQHYGIVSLTSGNFLTNRNIITGGRIYVSDGISYAYVDVNWQANKWYILLLQFGFLENNVSKMRVGYMTPTGPSWGATVVYDGQFTEGANLIYGYGIFAEAWFGPTLIWRGFPPDSFLNQLGD